MKILELSEMARHPLKYLMATVGMSVVIAASFSSATYAFTETTVPPAAQATPPAAPAPLQLNKADDGQGLALTAPSDTKGETELNIPGIGSVGSLPKLDFGLELLYGSGGGAAPEQPLDEKNDDVLIKGTIKHRF